LLASISEISYTETNIGAAIREAASRPVPTLIRIGTDHHFVKAFERDSLSSYREVSINAESSSADGWSGTLGDFLTRLDNRPGDGLYMKHTTLTDIDPQLVARVLRPVRELNWLSSLPNEMRPSWYWLMAGQAGTGTPLHVDSMASAAWNLLITGRKIWRFLPPAEAVHLGMIPIAPAYYEFQPVEFEQTPGDLLFTPSGWAHAVENPTETIAVTGNYIGEANIDFAISYFEAVGEHNNALLCQDVKRAFTRKDVP
jgi:histone arginine demethylase JMJD6